MPVTNTTTLSIPKPCSENWQAMQAVGDQQRFCGHCQRHVTDFSGYTTGELIAYFRQAEGRVCGRLTNRQLELLAPPPIVPQVQQRSSWRKYLAGVFLLLAARQGAAQSFKTTQQATDTVAVAYKGKEQQTTPKKDELYIAGTVIDDSTGKPIKGVIIKQMGKSGFAVSDSLGRFKLPVKGRKKYIKIEFSHLGYRIAFLRRRQTEVRKPIILKMIQDNGGIVLGDIAYTQ